MARCCKVCSVSAGIDPALALVPVALLDVTGTSDTDEGGVTIPCYHPMRAYPVGINCDTGRVKYAIRKSAENSEPDPDSIIVPCGQCIGCRLERSRQWANRCMMELKDHRESVFVTLTYDNPHLPQVVSPASGLPVGTLRKRDLQLFFKRLRKSLEPAKIRYYACGEYGPQTMRPHYHAIIFGYSPSDLRPHSKSPQGYQYWISDSLARIWSNGHVLIGEVTWDTCAYTARYIASKLTGDDGMFYSDNGVEAPFTVCSRKPGIGSNYYDSHPGLFESPKIFLPTEDGCKEFSPPDYFFRKLRLTDPEKYDSVKLQRRRAAELLESGRQMVSQLPKFDQLRLDEEAHIRRAASLERRFI